LVVASWFLVSNLELHIYTETTERRTETITRLVDTFAPDAWQRLLSAKDPSGVLASAEGKVVANLLKGSAEDGHAAQLKVFNSQRFSVYASSPGDIGVREENDLLRKVLETGKPEIETTIRDGKTLYEIYIPIMDATSGQLVVYEVYEPASIIDEIIVDSFIQAIAAPLLLIGLIGIWLDRLTGRAQAEIDARVTAQDTLRRQLERFVSQSAVGAAKLSSDGVVQSKRVGMALFYSDVRDFSSLAEFHPPQETVDFLNTLMTIQVDAICRHGGDVDKMIGDAVLARFEGADREARAIRAAQEILTALTQAPLARGIGIGIYDGEAILGAIGPEERQDFTVIGDSVNIAARLCSLAKIGEVVVDELALRRSGLEASGFSPAEKNKVKGRTATVTVRRWHGSQDRQ
jgi:adenylate cyclase